MNAIPSPAQSLLAQVAIVTGASRGIGRAIALELARAGSAVVVNYRERRDDAQDVVAAIEAEGGRAFACPADVSKAEDVSALINATLRHFGQIDALVCNAGTARSRLAATSTEADWQAMHGVGLWGSYVCIQQALPHMIARHRGAITCVSSIAGERGARGLSSYAAVKGGVNAMVRSLAVELACKGIRVNAVSPGIIRTDMTRDLLHLASDELLRLIPQGRLGEPEEVARAVRFLTSAEASYITGAVLGVDGGLGA